MSDTGEETKETWQVDVLWESGLDPGKEKWHPWENWGCWRKVYTLESSLVFLFCFDRVGVVLFCFLSVVLGIEPLGHATPELHSSLQSFFFSFS